jgi:hypothetical protein
VLSWAAYREGLLDAIEGLVKGGEVLERVKERLEKEARLRG